MSDYFFVMAMRELKNPLEMILAILFGAAILILIYGEFRITAAPEVLYLRTPNKRYGISC